MLDADIFMAAARSYYSFRVAPKFWRELVRLATDGRLLSIDKVWEDIERGQDDLAEWAAREFRGWFDSTNQIDVLSSYGQLMNWAQAEAQFSIAAKAEFASASDGWLVAYAHAKNCVVVTNETYAPDIRRRIKIPNACRALGVPYVNTFEMVEALQITL